MTAKPSLRVENPPQGWEVRVQLTLIEPVATTAIPLSMNKTAPQPRANLVVNSRLSADTDFNKVAAGLFDELLKAIPGSKRLDSGSYAFDDGQKGSFLSFSFEGAPGLRVVQKHIVRLDGNVLTHYTATVDEPSLEKLARNLDPLAKSYVPPALA